MDPKPPHQQPALNVPPAVLYLTALLVGCYVLQQIMPTQVWVELFAFVPARYGVAIDGAEYVFRGEPLTDLTSLVTYGLFHGGITHLVINSTLLLAAGAPVARGMTVPKFFLFAMVCSVAGACIFYFFHRGELVPVIGASAAVSGMLGAVGRIMFAPAQALLRDGRIVAARRIGLAPLGEKRLIAFALVWTVINLLGGAAALGTASEGTIGIAWEAHIGGFFAGLFLVPFFMPNHGANPQKMR